MLDFQWWYWHSAKGFLQSAIESLEKTCGFWELFRGWDSKLVLSDRVSMIAGVYQG